MAYEQLEELTSRKREKVALFLTAENMAGLLAIGLPAYIVTTNTAFWLRLLILSAEAVLGVALTSEIHGLAFYERALWWLRGRVRRWIAGSALRPAEFTAAPASAGDRALPLQSPVRRVTATALDGAPPARHAPAQRIGARLDGRVAASATPGGRQMERVDSAPGDAAAAALAVACAGPPQ